MILIFPDFNLMLCPIGFGFETFAVDAVDPIIKIITIGNYFLCSKK